MLDATELRHLIDRTRYAIADGSSKYLLQGALLTLNGSVAAMVATDSKRLALATMSRQGTDARAIVPTKALDVLSSQMHIGEVGFTVGERRLFFQAGVRLLVSRTIEGEFPKYERIIPRDGTRKAVIERAALAAAIKRVGLVSDRNQAAYFSFAPEALDITSSSAEIGDADERVPIGYEGEPLKVCCNWTYLLDFLGVAVSDTITLSMKDEMSPILLMDGEMHVAVVMTMRA